MDKQREIELFRENKLNEYIELAQNNPIERLKIDMPRCWQCKQFKQPHEFYVLNKNGICLCKACAEKNYQAHKRKDK